MGNGYGSDPEKDQEDFFNLLSGYAFFLH